MARILVLGAALNGLSTAMLLARDGHDVTVLERDADEPHGDRERLWTSWQRPGVAQFRLLNVLLGLWTRLMTAELPDVVDQLVALGGSRTNDVHRFPAEVTGGVRPGDPQFDRVTARRPIVEAAVAACAARTSGLTVRRGVRAAAVLDDTAGGPVPHVAGIRTSDGESLLADLVVDAGGRHTQVPAMLAAQGARPPREERDDVGFVYFSRHFRAAQAGAPTPEMLLQHFHGYSVLTLPCDGGTWGLGLVASAHDHALRGLRDEDAWQRAMSSVATARPWLDGEPISGVTVMAGIEDRLRSYVVQGDPVCTGLVPVGDAWACTNPSLGRGASLGLLHAVTLRDVLREVPATDRDGIALAFDAATQERLIPWYRMTQAFDRHRIAEIAADVAGETYDPPDPAWAMSKALYSGALRDPELLRAYLSITHLLATPTEVLAQPGIAAKALALRAGGPRYPEDAPTHAELVSAVTG